MTPNTFEGITLGGKLGFAEYLGGGYLWNIKPRNSDTFVSIASAAGVKKHLAQADVPRLGYQFRLSLNWERTLF